MHFKKIVAASSIALANASPYGLQNHGTQMESGSHANMIKANEFAVRDMESYCFSTRPVDKCQEDYIVKATKRITVDFHCVSRNSIDGQRWKQQVENDEVIPEMTGKSVHVQGRVQVPTKCVEKSQVNEQEQRRRRMQQQHGNRVELIETGLKEFDQENQWETEEDEMTAEQQYNHYRKNRRHEENEWQRMQSLFNQYPELTQKKLHQLVKQDQSKYQQVADQLNELVQQKKVSGHLMAEIQNTLPTFFNDVAKQVYEAMQEQNEQNKHHRTSVEQQPEERLDQLVGNKQEFKNLMRRAYVYIVKEAVKLNAQNPQRLANTQELTRKVWEKLQRTELTRAQIEKVNEVQQKIEQLLELDQTNQLIGDELVSDLLRASHKQARKNMMRIVITTLMMENQPTFQTNQNFEQNY